MSESGLSRNLQYLMRIYGNISVSELARFTNIPQPTIHHILKGLTKTPRKKALEAISAYFSISPEQLSGDAPLPNTIPDAIKEDLQINTIPIIDWDLLRNWPISKVKQLNLSEILLDKPVAKDSFALKITDENMEPMFPKNSIMIFNPGKIPKDRDYVVVYKAGENKILFNRLFSENNEFYIKHTMNDGNVQLIKLDMTSDRILGTLIEVRIQY